MQTHTSTRHTQSIISNKTHYTLSQRENSSNLHALKNLGISSYLFFSPSSLFQELDSCIINWFWRSPQSFMSDPRTAVLDEWIFRIRVYQPMISEASMQMYGHFEAC